VGPAEQPGGSDLVVFSARGGISRNHRCEELSDLVEFAEGYLEDRQPFRLKLGEDYKQLERSPP
jgi:hypothetical protein